MKVIFDDFVERYDDLCTWSCICPACKEKYKIPYRYLDETGEGMCGVKGCWNEASDYIDFPNGSTKIVDLELEFTFKEEAK